MKILTGNNFMEIVNYFNNRKLINNDTCYCSPYLHKYELTDKVIKDNLFNFRCVVYGDDDLKNLCYIRMRKKPLNSVSAELVFYPHTEDTCSVTDFQPVLNYLSYDCQGISKIDFSVMEKNCNKKLIRKMITALEFNQEVTYYDEFGLNKNVLVFSKTC